ncbi:hypothetical protein BK767_29865 [Bacillus thuringiensis serovar kyushuensis]|uniref:hypothetical protein n=1 Tax=Bacillus thuringiensis TaxID=1428 RepID=UPI000B444FAA|nr:hypothetical protein [Bacillus thuringiensis]MEC2865077.1 hypothetical protein [Bacillus cereus]OTZ61294.1 hypothetical protein BK767_29865 [Bacillus thuringiensis serovar kyushuensis]OTZ66296.1 hypothetical protein BK768_26375 [Bacillus thuringiensis serovar tohokuensis]OUB78511.1 hypothetical protein BK773_29185 [Bacillus thuringiensis serovar indiana]
MLNIQSKLKKLGTATLAGAIIVGASLPSTSYAQEMETVLNYQDEEYQFAFSQSLKDMESNLRENKNGYFLQTKPSATDILNGSTILGSLPGAPIYNSNVPFVEVPTHIAILSPDQYRDWRIKVSTRTRYIDSSTGISMVKEVKTEFYNGLGELQAVTGVFYPEKSITKEDIIEKVKDAIVIDSDMLNNMMRL